jgi:hypothetical protein
MRLLAVLACGLGMLIGGRRMLFALSMVPFAMMLCRSAMRFRSIFVLFIRSDRHGVVEGTPKN